MSVDINLMMRTVDENDIVTDESYQVWDGNFTSNLGSMAVALDISKYVYGSPETQGVKAKHFIIPIQAAVEELHDNGAKYKKYEANNGWGTVEQFQKFLSEYLEALKEYPGANVWFN